MKETQSRPCRVVLRNCNQIPDRDRRLIEERFLCSLEALMQGAENVRRACESDYQGEPRDGLDPTGPVSPSHWISSIRSARTVALRACPDATTAFFEITHDQADPDPKN